MKLSQTRLHLLAVLIFTVSTSLLAQNKVGFNPTINAQNSNDESKRFAVHFGVGSTIGSLNIGGQLDYYLIPIEDSKRIFPYASVGFRKDFGAENFFMDLEEFTAPTLGFGVIFGTHWVKMEVQIDMVYDPFETYQGYPSFSFGWRYQRSDSPFVARMAFGLPRNLVVGIGYSF